MKVKELIQMLQLYDPEATVCEEDFDFERRPEAKHYEFLEIRSFKNRSYYDVACNLKCGDIVVIK